MLQVEQGRHCPLFKVSLYCGRVEKTSDKTGEEKGVFQKGVGLGFQVCISVNSFNSLTLLIYYLLI